MTKVYITINDDVYIVELPIVLKDSDDLALYLNSIRDSFIKAERVIGNKQFVINLNKVNTFRISE